jgi:hypothetical protein
VRSVLDEAALVVSAEAGSVATAMSDVVGSEWTAAAGSSHRARSKGGRLQMQRERVDNVAVARTGCLCVCKAISNRATGIGLVVRLFCSRCKTQSLRSCWLQKPSFPQPGLKCCAPKNAYWMLQLESACHGYCVQRAKSLHKRCLVLRQVRRLAPSTRSAR